MFGPQGEQVAALIERSRALSAAEADRLAAAWGAAWGAAWDAARGATWAAWDASRATRRAAWKAAWDASRGALDAARGATWGLLLRDLIGQYPGWDQAAYDLLTGPWRSVIGPAHPDDHPEVAS